VLLIVLSRVSGCSVSKGVIAVTVTVKALFTVAVPERLCE